MGYHFSLKLFVLYITICRQLILDRNAPMVKISRHRKFKRFIGNMCAGCYCCDGSIWWMCLGGNNISSRIRKKVSSKQWVIFYASGQFLKSCASWVENMSSLWASPLLHFTRNAEDEMAKSPNWLVRFWYSYSKFWMQYPQEKSQAASKKYNLPEIGIKVCGNQMVFLTLFLYIQNIWSSLL